MPKVKLSDSGKEWRCIGKNIELRLVSVDMSRKEFAARMNICESVLSGWISGKRPVATERIYQAARVLKTTPAELVTPGAVLGNAIKFKG